MNVTIQYSRLSSKPKVAFTEGFVFDNGYCLKTHSIAAPSDQRGFSEQWWNEGLIPHGQIIHTVTKYLFYNEWFDILELRTADGQLLGHYSDICTPLKKIGESDYALTDLFLDLWRFPDGSSKELDWDEFHQAAANNLIPEDFQPIAQQTLQRLVTECQSGRYPFSYFEF